MPSAAVMQAATPKCPLTVAYHSDPAADGGRCGLTLRPRGREHWDCPVHGRIPHSRVAAPSHVASSGEAA